MVLAQFWMARRTNLSEAGLYFQVRDENTIGWWTRHSVDRGMFYVRPLMFQSGG